MNGKKLLMKEVVFFHVFKQSMSSALLTDLVVIFPEVDWWLEQELPLWVTLSPSMVVIMLRWIMW